MKDRKTALILKCVTLALALAVLAAPSVQARAATGARGSDATGLRVEETAARGKAGPQDLALSRQPPKPGTGSYFWLEAGIAAGVLAGIVVLGLWGDVMIGGLIFGVQVLAAGAALAARKARALGRETWPTVVAGPVTRARDARRTSTGAES